MLPEIDDFYLQQKEPDRSTLLALRKIILGSDPRITESWKYKMPFFCINGKIFCYLWIHKELKKPYLGIVEGKKVLHPQLISENRSRMKIMIIDPERDFPLGTIRSILKMALLLYK